MIVTSGGSFSQLSCLHENNQVLSLVVPFTKFLQMGIRRNSQLCARSPGKLSRHTLPSIRMCQPLVQFGAQSMFGECCIVPTELTLCIVKKTHLMHWLVSEIHNCICKYVHVYWWGQPARNSIFVQDLFCICTILAVLIWQCSCLQPCELWSSVCFDLGSVDVYKPRMNYETMFVL